MCNTSASFVECRISATGRVFVATSSSNVANAVAGVEGDQSEDTLNRSLIDLSPGESYCARSRFPQWHSSLLSRFSHSSGGGGSPFSLPHTVFPFSFSSRIFLTLSRYQIPPPVRSAYTVAAPISVCGKLLGGRACIARGEVAVVTTAATSGQSLVRPTIEATSAEASAPRQKDLSIVRVRTMGAGWSTP